MKKPDVLYKAAETPSAGATITGGFAPGEVLPESTRRLGWAGLVYAGGFTVGFPGWLLFDISAGVERPYWGLRVTVNLLAIALGLGMFILVRYSKLRPRLLLDIGLVFLVLGSFFLSMTEFWGAWPEWSDDVLSGFLGVPWECCWIITFALLAPNTPGKTLIAALAAASTAPFVFLLSKAVGATSAEAPVSYLFGYFLLSTYLCAGVAFLISIAMNKLARQLKKARDVGSYKLVRRFGAGGMGEVWVAQHKMLARPAAVKLIKPEALGSDERSRRMAVLRFRREAQATAALTSYHTIDLYDYGATEDGSFYYVMELLRGMSLDSLIDRFGPVSSGRVVHLMRQVCHSLGEAHANGLIHRDIKPANIFVCRIGPSFDYDFIKLLDFGLVKAREAEEGGTELTAEGLTTGTPAYMAPEMATGKGTIDGRADIYCLGCVGYWLLTGQRVFDGESALGTVVAHVQEQPLPPSERTELEIPAELELIILRCLEKDPAERPQTATELDELLAACGSISEWGNEQAREWWNLHAADLDPWDEIDVDRELTPEEIIRVED
jgi:serine/threonine-protein kinase